LFHYSLATKNAEANPQYMDPTVGLIFHNTGDIYLARKDIDGAIKVFSMGLRIFESTLRPDNSIIAKMHIDLAYALQLDGQVSAALTHLYQARDILVAVVGPEHKEVQAVQSIIESAPIRPDEK